MVVAKFNMASILISRGLDISTRKVTRTRMPPPHRQPVGSTKYENKIAKHFWHLQLSLKPPSLRQWQSGIFCIRVKRL